MNKITTICCAAVLFLIINACEYEVPTHDVEIEETVLNAKGAPAPSIISDFITLPDDDNVEYCDIVRNQWIMNTKEIKI